MSSTSTSTQDGPTAIGPVVGAETPTMELGKEYEITVDCDKNTPAFVAKLRGITGSYQGERLTGLVHLKFKPVKSLKRFTDAEAIAWARKEFGGVGIVIVSGQLAKAVQEAFPRLFELGVVAFSAGGSWLQYGPCREGVYLGRIGQNRSYLGGHTYNYDNDTWGIGALFLVVLEQEQLPPDA